MPTRIVIQGDGPDWLRAHTPLPPDHAIVVSLPDHTELSLDMAAWRAWFLEVAGLCCRAIDPRGVVIFYQSDCKHEGVWIDKGYLASRAADDAGLATLFHRIVCRVPPGEITFGRPAYTHLLGFSRDLRLLPGQSMADVMPDRGEMTWSRAMGREACDAVARFLVRFTACRVVVDPCCGMGSMLAAANRAGLDAIGVDRSRKRVERARALEPVSPAPP